MWIKSKDGSYSDTDSGAKIYAREVTNGQGVMRREVLLLRPSVQNVTIEDGYESLPDAQLALDNAMESAGVTIAELELPVAPAMIDDEDGEKE